jgi:hypothetical protein
MSTSLRRLQVAILAIGTIFSWTTLVLDYRSFFDSGGTVLQFGGCAVTNPLATPCFYGALAFAIALAGSIAILRATDTAAIARQRGLNALLIAGTLFAWGNFAYEAYRYLQPQPSPSAFSCPAGEAVPNPFATSCFYGALIFSAALLVSTRLRRGAAAGAPLRRVPRARP